MVNPYDAKGKADEVLRLLKSTVEVCFFNLVLLRGTCLGFVRDRDFIEKDNDIDIGILSNNQECTPQEKLFVTKKLLKSGFIHPGSGMLSGQEHWWAHNDCILICIRWVFDIPNTPSFSQLRFLQSFDQVEYNEESYNVPHPVEDYLTYFYSPEKWGGVDWRTPCPKNWKKALK